MTTVAMSVTRTELTLADLSLINPGSYEVPTFSIGAPGNVLDTVESKWVDGAYPIGKHRGNATAGITVDCIGSSHANCQTKLDAVVDAFNQLNFNWTATYDAATYTWRCFAASVIDADMASREFEHGRVLSVRITFPRHPIPVAGPI